MPTDPVEKIVAAALDLRGIRYLCDGEGDTKALDFYLPDFDLYIETKRYHTDRVAEQMSRVENVIVVQGMSAAQTFAKLLER